MLADGFHDVAPGKIATVVTSLEMRQPPPTRPEADGSGWVLRRLESPSLAEYRELYSAVGRDWLWFSRLVMPDEELAAILGAPGIEVYRLEAQAGVGILELDFRAPGECELAFFGVSPGLVGGGAGRWLMNRAVQRAWSQPIERFWVHTCSLDHPGALPFYVRSGFTPFRRQVEVADDPRLLGLAPRDSAGHVPLL
jgi:GNAT superfamily N-acetyltransferase